ncbi:hypothetical protein [Stigmatella aurantiaca]|nr:hypothetical protein [Stigmatella aurantiaca]
MKAKAHARDSSREGALHQPVRTTARNPRGLFWAVNGRTPS